MAMLRTCFYLLFAIGCGLSLHSTDFVLFEDPQRIAIGIMNIFVRNVHVNDVYVPPMAMNFTADDISLQLDEPATLSGTAQASIFSGFGYSSASLWFSLTGGVSMVKNSAGACTSSAVMVKSCDLNAHVRVKAGRLIDFDFDVDACEQAEELLTTSLMPPSPPLTPLPALEKGASSVRRGSFFNSLVLKTKLLGLIGGSASAGIISDTAVHFHYNLLFPVDVDVDTEKAFSSVGARLIGGLVARIWGFIRDALRLPSISSVISAVVTDGAGKNVSVSLSGGDDLLADLAANNASLLLSSYVPRNAAVDFDIVAVDHRCNLFGLVCTLPAKNGLQVMNVRFSGFGDADSLFTNLLANTTESLLNRIVTDTLTVKSLKTGNRIVLSPL